MGELTLGERLRSWLAGLLFSLAGKLDESYDVWLDDAPRREDDPETLAEADREMEHEAQAQAREP